MKIALIGYGKMGKAIERLALAAGHEVCLRWGGTASMDELSKALAACEVAIEFSRPDVAEANIRTCLDAGIPLVCGTTGWTEHLAEIQAYAKLKMGRFLFASNFSLGMNILFELNRRLAAYMQQAPDFKVDMEEIHHIHKLDAPSGTAITIAEGIMEGHAGYSAWGDESAAQPVIPIQSKRIGEVPGTHEVRWQAAGMETLSLKHEAHSRDIFAQGALVAAGWLVQQEPGCYGMADVLGF
ncbi:MAG: 4-hydroxy-tetrahydrodipicolinate reductase [Phaeodactylibacter sp.]|nr:4-hydroxy-tetrahydrodipicolinate reductase [Phaeodactylibacter sp.]